MQETRLSVALVTRNRPASLKRTLKSLRDQSVQPWEVIVSDDSDSDQATEVKDIVAAYQCHYIPGAHSGLYANRNRVALACHGTHIRTMDDDHEFPAGHVAECLAAIDRDPAAVWIIGEYLPNDAGRKSAPECPGQLHPRGFSVRPPNPDDSWALADGATIYPREIFDRGLRFAEAFRFGAAYLEFGSRLHFLGYRIRQLPSTHIIHYYESGRRSLTDPEEELAAEFFAMLCHSFIYQRTPRNELLTIAQIGWMTLRRGGLAARAFRKARTEFRKQQARIIKQAAA